MKRFIFTTIAASAAIFLAAGCQDLNDIEQPSESIDRNIITASIPENIASKVAMNAPASGKGLSLAWEAGDELTVIGETTEQFTIAEGFTAHNAKFNGQEVGGESSPSFIRVRPTRLWRKSMPCHISTRLRRATAIQTICYIRL